MSSHKDKVIDLYSHFYRKLYKRDYAFQRKDVREVEAFVSRLDKIISPHSRGQRWYYYYFIYQFNYWCALDIKAFDKVRLQWLIGKKAVDRYFGRNKEFDFMLDRCGFVIKYHIIRSEFLQEEKENFNPSVARGIDDRYRALYFNQGEGFVRCLEQTSLYDPKSLYCLRCKFKVDCKEILKSSNEKLYSVRCSS